MDSHNATLAVIILWAATDFVVAFIVGFAVGRAIRTRRYKNMAEAQFERRLEEIANESRNRH